MKKKQKIERRRAKAAAQAEMAARVRSGERPRAKEAGEKAGSKGSGRDRDSFRRQQSIKTAKWNRYMMIRYFDAGLFFVGLYWALMLLAFNPSFAALVPAVELVVALIVMVEVFTVLSRDTEYLMWSHRLLIASCALSLVAIAVTLVGGEQLLFPFFNGPLPGIVLCLVLVVLKLAIIRRIVLVRDRRDKRYKLYEQAVKYNS